MRTIRLEDDACNPASESREQALASVDEPGSASGIADEPDPSFRVVRLKIVGCAPRCFDDFVRETVTAWR